MNETTQHTEWLNLIDRTGPFLSPLVLEGAFPQGLDKVETALRKRLREAYGEWRDAIEEADRDLPELHRAWVQLVLEELLEYDNEILLVGDSLPETLSYTAPEHGTTVRPDMALDTNGRHRLLVTILEPDTDPDAVVRGESWPASPVERMTLLCRATGVSLGLVTDGERWMLIFAPKDGPAEYGTWYAHYWRREPITLQAFASLLGVRRFFGPEAGWPETLLEKSLGYQDEITDTLGGQVRRAVEMLVQALDRADIERNRKLLQNVRPAELYEAGLTVMMRLVFLLCAEERGLLLLGDEAYDRHYAISTLRAQLGEDASRVGLEVLERRHDAWSRLLAIFRGIYGGISHETLRLPALGGSLFDPDRFPFLEGRTVGSSWKETTAFPLPIDNRTVLALLRALQVLEQRGGAQVLSYKALDVEQIGYVYEGLLEQTVAQVPETTLGLIGSQQAKRSDVPLSMLEQARAKSDSALIDLLVDITARSKPALTNLLVKEVDEELAGMIILACGGDGELAARIRPFGHLLRTDLWGAPLVYRKEAFAVTFGTDRRQSGSHYTPKVLTEKIVAETLEPITYVGPAEGHPREEWRLKSPSELLDLKVCDPAMGSGAFLVQVCRWLGQRLVESWGQAEGVGKVLTVDGEVIEGLGGAEPMSDNAEERLVLARRLIAERCIYGVDLNPLAVELAKLSIWLVTLAKGRPFGFLDHNMRHGDSLLGIHRIEQLIDLDMQPGKDAQGRTMLLFAKRIRDKVSEAIQLRGELRGIPIRDIRDVEAMASLDAEARRILNPAECVADALIGEALAGRDARALSLIVDPYLGDDANARRKLIDRVASSLRTDLPAGRPARKPFHWPLEFPEVFFREHGGFDVIVGNPPFMGGSKIATAFGPSYREYIVAFLANGRRGQRGQADLCSYFFCRLATLLGKRGQFGVLATNTIAQGDSRIISLDNLSANGYVIYYADPNRRWPGKASVTIAMVCIRKGSWSGSFLLDGVFVAGITPFLGIAGEISGTPFKLAANKDCSFEGSRIEGQGFVLKPNEAENLIKRNPRNREVLKKYLRGTDFLSRADQSAAYWVINFNTWPLSAASAPKGYSGPVASDFPECLDIIEKKVKPQRLALPQTIQINITTAANWWRYRDVCPALHAALERTKVKKVLFHAFTSKYVAFAFVSSDNLFAAPHNVFVFDDWGHFSVLQSSIHIEWAYHYGSTLKTDLRYTRSSIFETFPFPSELSSVENIGKKYHESRKALMLGQNIGLRDMFKKFHDPKENKVISEIRELHIEMDYAVVKAYGWDDLVLDHGFYETNQGTRFTVSENVRNKILQRLLKLNHDRHEEELLQGFHPQKGDKKRPSTKRKVKKGAVELSGTTSVVASEPQLNLFGTPEQPTTKLRLGADKGEYWLDAVADKILEWLEYHDGWHLKETVLQSSGVEPSQWDEAIAKLLKSEGIQVRGSGEGLRYRVNM
jgi:hypothetical protein